MISARSGHPFVFTVTKVREKEEYQTKNCYICGTNLKTKIMNQQDIRWQQRFSNYKKALIKLKQAVEIMSEKVEHSDEVDESSLL